MNIEHEMADSDFPERPTQPPPTAADFTPWCLVGKRYKPKPVMTPDELERTKADHRDRLEKLASARGLNPFL